MLSGALKEPRRASLAGEALQGRRFARHELYRPSQASKSARRDPCEPAPIARLSNDSESGNWRHAGVVVDI